MDAQPEAPDQKPIEGVSDVEVYKQLRAHYNAMRLAFYRTGPVYLAAVAALWAYAFANPHVFLILTLINSVLSMTLSSACFRYHEEMCHYEQKLREMEQFSFDFETKFDIKPTADMTIKEAMKTLPLFFYADVISKSVEVQEAQLLRANGLCAIALAVWLSPVYMGLIFLACLLGAVAAVIYYTENAISRIVRGSLERKVRTLLPKR